MKKGKKISGAAQTGTAFQFLPESPVTRKLLLQRARQLAQRPIQESVNTDQVNYIRFKLGASEFYGIPYQYAVEVIYQQRLTRVPAVPDYIAGVINRHGRLLAVLDLKKFFPVEPADYAHDVAIIIVTAGHLTLGILADSIVGQAVYDSANVGAVLPSEAVTHLEYLSCLHNGDTVILDIEKMLADISLRAGKASQEKVHE